MDATKRVLSGVLLADAIATSFWLFRGQPDVAIGSRPPSQPTGPNQGGLKQ